jgi:peptidylprolyl isomerase
MASGGPGTSSIGSQFFITYDALPQLDGNFTIIGRVIEGMDVAESITPRDPSQGAALPPGDVIETILIDEQ